MRGSFVSKTNRVSPKTDMNQNNTLSSSKRFLLYAAGSDAQVAAETTSAEINRLCTLGQMVLIPTSLALLSGTFCAYFFTQNLLLSLPVGIAYATAIFFFDRALAGSTKGGVWVVLARLTMMLVLSFTISFPLEMAIFSDVIDDELAADARSHTLAIEQRYKAEQTALKQALAARQDALTQTRKAWLDEMDGSGGSGNRGDGRFARQKYSVYRADSVSLVLFETETRQALARLQEKERQEAGDALDSQAKVFIGRLKALGRVAEREPIVQQASWLIMLCLIVLELTPLVYKLASGKGLYEKAVQSQNAARLAALEATYTLREQVEQQSQEMILQERLNSTGLCMTEEYNQFEIQKADKAIEALLKLARAEANALKELYQTDLSESRSSSIARAIQSTIDRHEAALQSLQEANQALDKILS